MGFNLEENIRERLLKTLSVLSLFLLSRDGADQIQKARDRTEDDACEKKPVRVQKVIK